MNRITIPLALTILAILSTHSFAQPGPRGARPNAGQEAMQPNGPTPQQMAQMLLQNFDRDGNGELNLTELSAAMVALQQRMQQMNRGGQGGAGGPGFGGRGGAGGQGGGAGGRGGAGGQGGGAGGQGGGAGGRGGVGGKL